MVSRRHVATRVAGAAVALIAIVVGCNQLLGVEQGHPRPNPGDEEGGIGGDAGDAAADAAPSGTIKKLAAGDNFACALKFDGTVWCWGSDDYAQLGQVDASADETCTYQSPSLPTTPDGSIGTYTGPCRPAPAMVGGVTGATDLAVGNTFACALLSTGTVACWGSDSMGELGRPYDSPGESGHAHANCPQDFFASGTAPGVPCDPSPYPVMGLPPVDHIVAGSNYACARTTDAGVYCWGYDGDGELDSDGGQDPAYVPVPARARDVPAVSALVASLGDRDTCAIADGGRILCWGMEDKGDLGNCQSDAALCTVPDDAGRPFTGAIAIQAGYGHSCALEADGTIWCWGDNGSLAVLSGEQPCSSSAVPQKNSQVGTTVPAASFFDSRSTHVLAVDADGGLWGWADNTFGQLGTPPAGQGCCNYGYATSCSPIATAIPLDGGAVRLIATGARFSLAMTADGTVWAWGSNATAQLGQRSDGGGEVCPGDAGVVVGPCRWTATPVPLP